MRPFHFTDLCSISRSGGTNPLQSNPLRRHRSKTVWCQGNDGSIGFYCGGRKVSDKKAWQRRASPKWLTCVPSVISRHFTPGGSTQYNDHPGMCLPTGCHFRLKFWDRVLTFASLLRDRVMLFASLFRDRSDCCKISKYLTEEFLQASQRR